MHTLGYFKKFMETEKKNKFFVVQKLWKHGTSVVVWHIKLMSASLMGVSPSSAPFAVQIPTTMPRKAAADSPSPWATMPCGR